MTRSPCNIHTAWRGINNMAQGGEKLQIIGVDFFYRKEEITLLVQCRYKWTRLAKEKLICSAGQFTTKGRSVLLMEIVS